MGYCFMGFKGRPDCLEKRGVDINKTVSIATVFRVNKDFKAVLLKDSVNAH